METYNLKTKTGETILVEGKQKNSKELELLYQGQVLCIINAHRHDLDNIQKQFNKLEIDFENLTNINKNEELSPSNIIKGLEHIMNIYPETKARLASLKSQINNVFKKYSVLD